MLSQFTSVMGNSLLAGHVWSVLGWKEQDQFNFDQTKIKPVMKQFKLAPWSAVADLKLTRRRVKVLVQHHQLSKINVEVAKKHYEKSIGGWLPQHRLSRSLFMKETNKLIQKQGKFLTARDYDVLDDVFSLLDVDNSEELEAPEWALGLRLIFAGDEKKKLQMAFEMIDRDSDGTITKKEIHLFLLPYMNVIVPAGAEVLRPLLAWYCAEECMKDVAKHMQKDKVEEAPLDEFVAFCESRDIVLQAAERIDKKVYDIWLELEHESAFYARKDARKLAGVVRNTMSELPTTRICRSRQDSDLFLAAATDSILFEVDSCVSTSVSPEICTAPVAAPVSVPPPCEEACEAPLSVWGAAPPPCEEACEALRSPHSSAEIPTSSEIQSSNVRNEVAAPPLPPPRPAATQLKSLAADVEQPMRHAVADIPRGVVMPRLQMAQPTAFALSSPRPCYFSSPQLQMSPRVVGGSTHLWTHGSSAVVQYSSVDVPQVHTVMASPRLLSKVSSHVSVASVHPSSRGGSFHATPRSMSMQSCKSMTSAPLPHLLGVHRYQPEIKSKLLD